MLEIFQVYLKPLFLIGFWSLLLIITWDVFLGINRIIKVAKKMHKIPCNHCRYFTNNYRLKCTVNPHLACTEDAINCYDYRKKTYLN